MSVPGDAERVDLNVLGGPLEPCGMDPVTGFFRDGCCSTGPEDVGSHTVCAVVTREFLAQQQSIGNDLVTPHPEWRFPGLEPGDRWSWWRCAGFRHTRTVSLLPSYSRRRTSEPST